MLDKEPAVVLLSGGINSVVAATQAIGYADAHFLYLDQGHSAAQAELRAVRRLGEALAAKLHVVKLPSPDHIFALDSAPPADATSNASTAASPNARQRPTGAMLAMLAVGAQLAGKIRAESIVCGASQACNESDLSVERNLGHPESRHVFFHAAETALQMALPRKSRIEIDLPFMDMSRVDVLQAGLRAGAPLHLSWSCLQSGETPCGKCSGCTARAAAFDEIGLDDPIQANAQAVQ